MLTLYRRHRSLCKHRSRRYKSCSCPIWAQGVLQGVPFRKALDLTNWEAANRKINELEIHGESNSITVREACERWIDDCTARNLKEPSIRKYRHVADELKSAWGDWSLRTVKVDDVRKLREKWKMSATTTRKRLELLRGFFSFCVSSGWVSVNPAKALKAPQDKRKPTLPYSEEEWEKILWAADSVREVHKQVTESTERKLKALILLMRYSGLRISDAVSLKRDRITKGKLFLYQAKTGHPVQIPLPKIVLDALRDCDEGNPYYFWSGVCKLKTALTEWQERLKKAFEIAGIPDGHSHRLRDTFAVALLTEGVSLETVSILLGHNNLQTTQRHYSPWVKSRQDALEAAVRMTWN